MPKSTVSRRLSRLEEALGATLLMRTPRSMQVTETGQLLYRQGMPALSHLEDVERQVMDRAAEPSGPLRISAPPDLAAVHLGPLCADFLRVHPRVRLSVVSTNAYVNLIEEGVDVALRIHVTPLESVASLRARKLSHLDVGLYAAPDYLERAGRPRSPQQLQDHVRLGMDALASSWTLTHARTGKVVELAGSAALSCNDHLMLCAATVGGAGVALLPSFLAASHVRGGALQRILSAWVLRSAELSLVWPASHHTSPRVRAFVDMAVAHFKRDGAQGS